MTKSATPDHPIHELLAERWSPYAFGPRPVAEADLQSLFEAARWAAFSYNEQPWHYLVATQQEPEEFAKLLSCLVEDNQSWTKSVPVLAIGYLGDPAQLPEKLRARDLAPRTRRPLKEFIFTGSWGTPLWE